MFVYVRQNFVRRGRATLLALCIGALWCAARTEGASVTATIDHPTIAAGESVTLSLSFQGANAPQPALPPLPNFQLVGTGSSFSLDAARGIAQQTFTYQLVANQAGDFVIPAFQLKVGAETLTTQPIKVKVLKAGDAAAAPGSTLPSAFVRVITPKSQLYVGEMSEVEVHVYFQEGRLTQYPQLPADSGFTVAKWSKPIETRANVSNQLYNVIIFKQAVTPVKAGALNLGPATVSLFVRDRTRRQDFFFGPPEREVRMASEKAMIQILPIPDQNVPQTFGGAVGNFSITVSAAPTNVAAGDPITVHVQIRGRGALDAVKLPPQPGWSEFKTYPPTSQVENADPNNSSGTKTFEQVVVPDRAGIAALPPLSFSFFDPDQRSFRTVVGPLIPLQVRASSGGASALPSLPGSTGAVPAPPASDLAHIKPYLGIVNDGHLLMANPFFLGLQLVPPAAWFGLLMWRRHRQRLENNPRLRRRNEVSQKVRSGLNELRVAAAEKNSDAFFATVLRLLQERIGERLELPANAITEAVIEEKIRPSGAPAQLSASLQELFQMCNLARYAPVKSSQELSAVIPKLETALAELRSWEPSST